MIFIANKSREIEKNNIYLKKEIFRISENLKINKIEFLTHQNNDYLKKLHSLYFQDSIKNNASNIVSIKQFLKKDQNVKYVNAKK